MANLKPSWKRRAGQASEATIPSGRSFIAHENLTSEPAACTGVEIDAGLCEDPRRFRGNTSDSDELGLGVYMVSL